METAVGLDQHHQRAACLFGEKELLPAEREEGVDGRNCRDTRKQRERGLLSLQAGKRHQLIAMVPHSIILLASVITPHSVSLSQAKECQSVPSALTK